MISIRYLTWRWRGNLLAPYGRCEGSAQRIVRRIAGLSDMAAVERIYQMEDPMRRGISGTLLAAATVAAISCGTPKVDVTAETKRRIT